MAEWDREGQRWFERDSEGRGWTVPAPSGPAPMGSLTYDPSWQNFGYYFKTPDGKYIVPTKENQLQPFDPLSGTPQRNEWTQRTSGGGIVGVPTSEGALYDLSGFAPVHESLGTGWDKATVYNTAPTARQFQDSKSRSFVGDTFNAFMQGPGAVIGTGLGISGLAGALGAGGMAGAAGGAMDMGIGGIGEAMGLGGGGAAGGLAAGGAMDMGVGGIGQAMGSSGGGGWLDTIGGWVKNALAPTGGGAGGGTGGGIIGNLGWGDILKAGGNFLFNQMSADRANKLMEQVMQRGDALNQPQRAPYQALAYDLLQNPQGYMANNPFATAVADRYKNYVIPANVAKSGNPAKILDQAGSQFAGAIAGNYNNLAQILQGYGGFNQGPGGVSAGAGIGMQGLQSQAESFRGFGDLAERAFPDIFKSTGGPKQNPITNATTIFN